MKCQKETGGLSCWLGTALGSYRKINIVQVTARANNKFDMKKN